MISRLSKRLLHQINNFVIKHNKLDFIEILFANIAYKNNMSITIPNELEQLSPFSIDINMVDSRLIQHPLKNVNDHEYLRSKI